jgi:hypothetical protein
MNEASIPGPIARSVQGQQMNILTSGMIEAETGYPARLSVRVVLGTEGGFQ